MSDWDFLHEMRSDGYSANQIAEAAACGYNPWEWMPAQYDELGSGHQDADPELAKIFEGLVGSAKSYYALTGRYLQIWGELGELFAEIQYGIKRHKPHAQGSDGKLGNDFVEVKTISPEKAGDQVQVRRAGNFNKLIVIKISEEFEFDGRFIERKKLSKGGGEFAKVTWSALSPKNPEPSP